MDEFNTESCCKTETLKPYKSGSWLYECSVCGRFWARHNNGVFTTSVEDDEDRRWKREISSSMGMPWQDATLKRYMDWWTKSIGGNAEETIK
jgi:hypothetical protein